MATEYLGELANVYTAKKGKITVDAQGGNDTLVYDFSAIELPLRYYDYYGWRVWTDDNRNSLSAYGFEIYKFTGGEEGDDLRGGDMADVLLGRGGNDEIRGYKGADVIDGGEGHDRWIVDYSSIVKSVSLALSANADYALVGATGAKIRGIESVSISTGPAADVIDTSRVVGDDSIETGGGNDIVKPGLGRDTTNGGDGDDLLIMDYSSVLGGVRRIDLGYGWMRYADSFGVNPANSIDYYGFERFDLTGSAGSDLLYGGYGKDKLRGGLGNDALFGYGGLDLIDGGDGVDQWISDFSRETGHFSIDINAATQIAKRGSATASTILAIERLNTTLGVGNDRIVAKSGQFDDRMSSGAGNDILTVGRGKDWVHAGDGNDKLIVNWGAVTTPVMWSDQGYGWNRLASGSGDQIDYYAAEQFVFTGGSANDFLVGGSGLDVFRGGAGDDRLNSGKGRATIDGGAGIDYWEADLSDFVDPVVIDTFASQATTQGKAAGLSISKIEGLLLSTGDGNDVLRTKGYSTDDVVNTGKGDDVVSPGLGFDRLNGGEGQDLLVLDFSVRSSSVVRNDEGYGWFNYSDSFDAGKVSFYGFERFEIQGGTSADYLVGGGFADKLIGGKGNDVLDSGSGADIVDGGLGIDHWIASYGSAVDDLTLALNATGNGVFAGTDAVVRGIEHLTLTTGLGDDQITTSNPAGNDVIATGDGNDYVKVVGGMDEVNMGNGEDVLVVDLSRSTTSVVTRDRGYGWREFGNTKRTDVVKFYSAERLVVAGGSGADRLWNTGAGDDELRGGLGADVLGGDVGADRLFGDDGDDLLVGGAGADVLTGGVGADRFKFDSQSEGSDLITDFVRGEDKIEVVSSAFSRLPEGPLAANSLFVVSASLPALPVFVFDPGASQLSFDPDGSGGSASVLLATLSGVTALTSSDIVVVA